MRSSQITLTSKLGIIISTQYPNDNNGMMDEMDISKKVLDGLLEDRRRFSLLYEPDDFLLQDEQWMKNDLVIYQANPVAIKNSRVFDAVVVFRSVAVATLWRRHRRNNMRWFWQKEDRAEEVSFEDALLSAMYQGGLASREMALQIPTVSGGIDLIANIIASTPIKLYREQGGETQAVTDDGRVALLNDETGDTLNANEFWKAMVRDYYLGKGGYAYLHKVKGQFVSIHYVDERQVSIAMNSDPIFKDFDILVGGSTYKPFDFLKILRNTRDGATGIPITAENSKLIEVAYESLLFEKNLVKRGGNKKGFLKSEKRIDDSAIATLRTAFSKLYSNTSDNMVVLNNGVDFKESSDTSTEMQLNENKTVNAQEFGKLFHVSAKVMGGEATESDIASLARLAAIPLMVTIQCALNKEFLFEREKDTLYWAFDTKGLLKGDLVSRFNAYQIALDSNFMQIDEVRYEEDLKPLGLTWVKLGLQDVLYDPKTKTIYTPNTNQTSTMGAMGLPTGEERGTIEQRANPNRDKNGRFANKNGIGMGKKEVARVSGQFATDFPTLEAGTVAKYANRNYLYEIEVVEFGTYKFAKRRKLK